MRCRRLIIIDTAIVFITTKAREVKHKACLQARQVHKRIILLAGIKVIMVIMVIRFLRFFELN